MLLAVQVRYSVEAGLLLLAACVLLGPIIAERLRVPGLIGLIAAGTLLGPNVFDWLQPGGFVATMGAAGLLYLMFVAGIELDLAGFAANRRAALTFGLCTFAVPFALSWIVGRYYLGLGLSATALVGAMWASHTIVAYPEVKAAGIDRTRAVGVSLAATVITDVIALVVLAFAASSSALVEAPEVADELARGTLEASTTLPLWAGLVLLVVVCFGVVPRATRWLFAHVLHRRTERFVWALVAMSAGAIAGLLGGIEGLVGAFLAGIGMNSSVPARSGLMERIEFIGSALLIPAFLISVGLSIDPRAIAEPSTIALAGVFTATVVVGKVLAAVAAGVLGSFRADEIAVMATLTIGQAAATLAIARVGVETGLFDDRILNAAVLTVVATVIVTSVGTRLAARRLSVPEGGQPRLGDHVLVLAPDDDRTSVATFAAIASAMVGDDGGLVTPCIIRTSRTNAGHEDCISGGEVSDRLATLDRMLVRLGHDTDPVQRVADTLASGVGHLADEVGASMVVTPMARSPLDGHLDVRGEFTSILDATSVPIVAVSVAPSRSTGVVVLTGSTDGRPGLHADSDLAIDVGLKLAASHSLPLTVYSPLGDARPTVTNGRATHARYVDDADARVFRFGEGDLVVLPLPVLTRWDTEDRGELCRALCNVSLVVVAGSGR